ncbi:ArsR/SmtB family transcription factor [Streptomyces virginiae]|uniref:ArsR/SmtB family transcription factor n=1 Tax=Streptomyces virginiae TaxID=1961 RepID=UPI0036AF031B
MNTTHGLDVRIAPSPLWNLLGGVALLARTEGAAPWPYQDWAHNARRALTPRLRVFGLDIAASRNVSESFAPVLGSRLATPIEEIGALLRRTSATDLDRRVLADLSAFWETALAPDWPRLARSLEEEVLVRSRTLALSGGDALATELNLPSEVNCSQKPLTLVPMVLAEGPAHWTGQGDGRTVISYRARRAGAFAAGSRANVTDGLRHGDRMTLLLGQGRASVVRELSDPITTTELAERLGMAASTVSQHLSVLVSADAVQRCRVGTRVLYQLSGWGKALSECLENSTSS